MRKAILSLSVIAILTICTFNSVAAAPASKQTTDVHSNYAVDVKEEQQTYLTAYLGTGDATAVKMGVGQSINLTGVLSSGTPLGPPSPTLDYSHGIPNAMVYIQSKL